MTKLTGRPNGRPRIYTAELALCICKRISEGESVRKIARDNDMPDASTIHRWVLEDEKGFYKQYAKSKGIGAEVESEEMDEIARTEKDIQRAKLIIDTKKWNLSKKLPKRFGEKLDLTSDGEKMGNVDVSKLDPEKRKDALNNLLGL